MSGPESGLTFSRNGKLDGFLRWRKGLLVDQKQFSESATIETRTQRESNKSRRVGKTLAKITNPFGPSA